MAKKKAGRRSVEWFGKANKDGFHHRSWLKNQGLPHHLFDGRPVIGICNTWSELTPCNATSAILAERVKRGVYEMGGFPLEFPVMSLGETLMRPTTMMFRNLASMDVEESIRANPLDGVVLLVGCDKTTPGADHGGGVMRPADHRRFPAGPCSMAVSAARISARALMCGSSWKRSSAESR